MIVATTDSGLLTSQDGGRKFARVDGAPPLVFVSWPASRALYGVTFSGAVLIGADQGKTWQQCGLPDGRPEALTATDQKTVYTATDTGVTPRRMAARPSRCGTASASKRLA